MLRNIDMSEVSDGRLYDENDMARVDTGGCAGCHICCTGMGDSILIDPLDIRNMSYITGMDFNMLLGRGYIELTVKDYLILPNVKMTGSDMCPFLDEKFRCRIHSHRPSVCRLFPLGRIYENGDFKYFLQKNECQCDNKVKVKIKNWIGVDDVKRNHEFIIKYHDFLSEARKLILERQDDAYTKNINLMILQQLFMQPYTEENFYGEVLGRLYQLGKKW